MSPSLEILKVKKQLEGEVSAEAVDFVFHFLQMFTIYCKTFNLPTTTEVLVNELPKMVISIGGHLTDIYLRKLNLLYYTDISKILDCFLESQLFFLGPQDDMDHFKIESTFINDVVTSLKDYDLIFERNQKEIIEYTYANSGRT